MAYKIHSNNIATGYKIKLCNGAMYIAKEAKSINESTAGADGLVETPILHDY